MNEPATEPSAQLSCPSCQASITYYDVQGSTHYACPACHTYFEYIGEGPPNRLGRFQDPPSQPPLLPLGSIGTLPDGVLYRLVGYMLRQEARSPARWQEYVLFSPTAGYAQLAMYEGHWTLIRPAGKQYTVRKGAAGQHPYVNADNDVFNLYHRYSPRVLYAEGEFDYDIVGDEKLTIREFVAPPVMLVEEKRKDQNKGAWFRAEHLEPAAVAAAFGVNEHIFPYRTGVGAVQPAPGAASWPALKTAALWLILLVVLTQLALVLARPEKQLLSQRFTTGIGSSPNPALVVQNNALVLTSPSFQVTGPAAVEVDLRAEVDNSWVELPVALVNEQTGRSYEFTKSIEYYHGYEGGESWSEGSVSGDAVLAQVPTGRYHLNIYPTSENNRSVEFSLRVTQSNALSSNAVLLLLALLLWPAIQWLRASTHETQRWEQSDYGPQS